MLPEPVPEDKPLRLTLEDVTVLLDELRLVERAPPLVLLLPILPDERTVEPLLDDEERTVALPELRVVEALPELRVLEELTPVLRLTEELLPLERVLEVLTPERLLEELLLERLLEELLLERLPPLLR